MADRIDLDELVRKADSATAQSGNGEWLRAKPRKDGTAQVYSPSLGLLRKVVPVAETSDECGAFIASANPAVVRALVRRVREAEAMTLEHWAGRLEAERIRAVSKALATRGGADDPELDGYIAALLWAEQQMRSAAAEQRRGNDGAEDG